MRKMLIIPLIFSEGTVFAAEVVVSDVSAYGSK